MKNSIPNPSVMAKRYHTKQKANGSHWSPEQQLLQNYHSNFKIINTFAQNNNYK